MPGYMVKSVFCIYGTEICCSRSISCILKYGWAGGNPEIQEFNGVISVVALTANVFVQGKLAFMQTFADKSS